MIKCTLKPSNIHGIGVFTIKDVIKGEKLYCHTLKPTYYSGLDGLSKEVKNIIIQRWPISTTGQPYRIDDVRLLSFMNHSDNPNYDAVKDIALKDIKVGSEVTENYGKFKKVCLDINSVI